jgi:hypothetical protein
VLRVQLVPVAFGEGENVLLPDLSAEQIELMRKSLVKVFPIADVELSVRAQPLITNTANMVDLLDEVAALRDQENLDADLTYYGVVRFEPNLIDYCSPSCVLGASFTGETPSGGVGVGIGYTGERATMTFVHELGHVYGRPHSPCGVAGDPAFPYSGGRIGSWGYDVLDRQLLDPFTTLDFMGYCSPRWVSDHTYEQLRTFIADMGPEVAEFQTFNAQALRYRTLIIGGSAAPRWGHSRSMRLEPVGRRELATVHDAAGAVVTSLEVFRRRVADGSAQVIYVPEPIDARWVSLKLAGQALQTLPQKTP